MVQPCSEDHEKIKYRNLYKNTRQSTIRIWSVKDIIFSELFKMWFRFEEAEHVSSMEKEARLLWKFGMKIISPGAYLKTPWLHSYIHKVKFLFSFCWSHIILYYYEPHWRSNKSHFELIILYLIHTLSLCLILCLSKISLIQSIEHLKLRTRVYRKLRECLAFVFSE